MPVFAVIGAAVATWATGATFATLGAALAAGSYLYVAAYTAAVFGAAMITSRLINGSGRGGNIQDQGTRIQFPPNTEAKVPVVYGQAYQKGIITDAHVESVGGTTLDTMTYVLTLSEKTDTGEFSVGDIYWNDQKLNFKTGFNEENIVASTEVVVRDGTETTITTSTTLAGLVKIWVYAGGSSSANQIFGPSTAENAYDVIPEVDSSYEMNDLVFAVVKLTYSTDKGVTGLPQMTFQIENSLKNPGLVWYDYMTNNRYGAGIDPAYIDTASSISTATTSLYSISNTIPDNQYESDGTTPSTQVRYEINGVLNTGDTVKNNIDRINLASASWTAFDHKTGRWKIVNNRAETEGELATDFLFTDDNIIGEITLTATSLEDLYNSVEVAFPNRGNGDQTDYYNTATNVALLNDLEPENGLRLRLDMVNNVLHAGRIGNIELRQSRVDLIITFTADYSALQVEAGDVIKVTNDIYGFSEDLFRVTRIREVESEDGILIAEISALQYDAGVYADNNITDFVPTPISDIPIFNSSVYIAPPATPTITSSTATTDFQGLYLETAIAAQSYPVDRVELFASTDFGGPYTLVDITHSETGTFQAGETVFIDVPYTSLASGSYYFRARTGVNFLTSDFSPTSEVVSVTQGGLSGSSLYTDNIFINSAVPMSTYNVVLGEYIGDYSPVDATSDLTFDTATKRLYTEGFEVSTVTNLVYAMYQSTQTQTITTSTDAYQMTLNLTDFENDISRTGGTITLNGTGMYNLQWSGQFENPNAGAHNAYIWLRQNSVDVANSTGVVTIPAKHGSINGAIIAGWNYFIQTTATNETIELYWGADDTGISLQYIPPGTNPTRPGTASLIVTVDKMKD